MSKINALGKGGWDFGQDEIEINSIVTGFAESDDSKVGMFSPHRLRVEGKAV
jgi:hypothetical protein